MQNFTDLCIVLCTGFVLPCPSLPQQSSQNFCIFRIAKNYHPRIGAPLWRPGYCVYLEIQLQVCYNKVEQPTCAADNDLPSGNVQHRACGQNTGQHITNCVNHRITKGLDILTQKLQNIYHTTILW